MNVRIAKQRADQQPTPEPGNQQATGEQSLGRRAVVLGGSLAGLLTAAVLSRRFEQVVIVERDDLAAHPGGPRRGVPQGRHSHGLLVGGSRAMERLLPGLSDDLVARGAIGGDVVGRIRWYLGGTEQARFDSGMTGLLASRSLIEDEVRRRVVSLPNVVVLGGCDATGLLASADRRRVLGAQLSLRASGTDTGSPVDDDLIEDGAVRADLVVDATGRGSQASNWITDLGYPALPESLVPAGMTYVTRHFRQKPGVLEELDGDVVGSDPQGSRSGVALRQEAGTWTLTLAGGFGERPPTELADALAYARTLPTQGLAQIIAECEPVGIPRTTHYPNSRRLHWEKAVAQPERFFAIGDAMCSFNPVYGQGMSSAAMQVEALVGVLDAGLDGLPARAARVFAQVIETPWVLATGADRRHVSQPAKKLPERLVDHYLDRLMLLAPHDQYVARSLFEVLNMLAPAPSLLSPRIAVRVLRPGRRRRGTPGAPQAAGGEVQQVASR